MKDFVYHQLQIVAQDMLWMMDEVQAVLTEMDRMWHCLFHHHANMVETLHRDYHNWDFSAMVPADLAVQWYYKAILSEQATKTWD